MRFSISAVLTLVAALSLGNHAHGADPAKPVPAPKLLGAKIDDLPTRIAVPISKDMFVVFSFPEHYWIRSVSTLDAVGLRLDYVVDLSSAGSSSFIGIGVVDLPVAEEGEKPAARSRRASAEFFSTIGGYWSPYFELLTAVDKIKAEDLILKLDGRKAPAARSSRFNMKANAVFKTEDMYAGECVAFNVEGTETLVYVALNSLKGGTSMEKLLANVSVQKQSAVNRNGQRVALIDQRASKTARVKARFAWFDDAPGFTPCYTVPPDTDRGYASERVDDKGTLTASLRIKKRDPAAVSTPEEEGRIELSLMGVEGAGPPKPVDLLTKGVQALVYSYKSKFEERDCAASTAVFRFDDQIWAMTWRTFGDDARARADQIAFEYLLNRMQLAER